MCNGGPQVQRRLTFHIALFVCLSCVAVACVEANSEAPPPGSVHAGNVNVTESDAAPVMGGRIVFGLTSNTDSWNPAVAKWAAPGFEIARDIYDTLAAYDENSTVQPFLAQAFEHSADYKTWTIVLRDGVTFQNGKPLNARAVKRVFDYMRNSVLKSAYAGVQDVTTEGDLRVVVHMTDPWVDYPVSLTTQIGVVPDPDWLNANDGEALPVGTGPFTMIEQRSNDKIVLAKNPNYWRYDTRGNRYPYLDQVEFRPMPEEASRSASVLGGDIDGMQATSAQQILEFRDRANNGEPFQVLNATVGELAESFVMLNTGSPPPCAPNTPPPCGYTSIFSDDDHGAPPYDQQGHGAGGGYDARRALAYATNKQELVDNTQEGLFTVADGIFTPPIGDYPGSPYYTPKVRDTYPQYDPNQARTLVERYKARHGGQFHFTLATTTGESTVRDAQILQSQWRALGIDVELNPTEAQTYIRDGLIGQYDATLWQQFDEPNPEGDSVFFHPGVVQPLGQFSLNLARLKDDRIGLALDDARMNPQGNQIEDYRNVAIYLAQDLPYIMLYHKQISEIAGTQVVNLGDYQLPDATGKDGPVKGLRLLHGSQPMAQVWIDPAA